MSTLKEFSKQELIAEIDRLKEEVAELESEKADLEMMMEMSTEHSDQLEEDLLKQVESTLRESEKRFRLITETVPIPILVTRLADSKAVYVNESLCSLVGSPAENLLGKRSLDFLYVNPEDRKPLLRTLEKEGNLYNYELLGKKSDGTSFWVALFTQHFEFNDEPCLLSALYDITERRQAEEEIRQLREELQHHIKQRGGKYLTFAICGQSYGINILKIKEIITMPRVTPIPNTADFVRGVINLRGRVIPVVELRKHFGMEPGEYMERACIIVVEPAREKEGHLIGVIVDEVSEVINIRGESVEEPPDFGAGIDTDYIFGIAKINGGVKILLDIEKILETEDLADDALFS